jgi:hypothetical protein
VGEGRRVRGNLFFSATIGHDPAQVIACITARAQIRRSVTTFPARSLTGSPIAAVILPAIRYINRAYGCSTLAGLFRAARVGLVTPLRDGMNLVAKEYVASQNPDDPGVLILSRFAGAAHECQAALLVNPTIPTASPWRSSGHSQCRWLSGASGTSHCSRYSPTMTFNTGPLAFSVSWNVSRTLQQARSGTLCKNAVNRRLLLRHSVPSGSAPMSAAVKGFGRRPRVGVAGCTGAVVEDSRERTRGRLGNGQRRRGDFAGADSVDDVAACATQATFVVRIEGGAAIDGALSGCGGAMQRPVLRCWPQM